MATATAQSAGATAAYCRLLASSRTCMRCCPGLTSACVRAARAALICRSRLPPQSVCCTQLQLALCCIASPVTCRPLWPVARRFKRAVKGCEWTEQGASTTRAAECSGALECRAVHATRVPHPVLPCVSLLATGCSWHVTGVVMCSRPLETLMAEDADPNRHVHHGGRAQQAGLMCSPTPCPAR